MKQFFYLFFATIFLGCKQEKSNGAEMYYNGEILLPDYIHDDTLIVVDAEKLNVEIDSCDGSDGDISEALYRNCKKYFAK
jgi:hypothetical protein